MVRFRFRVRYVAVLRIITITHFDVFVIFRTVLRITQVATRRTVLRVTSAYIFCKHASIPTSVDPDDPGGLKSRGR